MICTTSSSVTNKTTSKFHNVFVKRSVSYLIFQHKPLYPLSLLYAAGLFWEKRRLLKAFPSSDLHSTDLHWKAIRKLLQVIGVAERLLYMRANATLCRLACHNLDSSDTQSNYCSPAASAGVTASGCPLAWILLATSKKQKDNGTVHFKAANEFSGVDVMLLSCPSSVWSWWAWVVLLWGSKRGIL